MLESTTTKTIMTIDTQEVGQARRHQDPCRDAHAPHTPHTSNATEMVLLSKKQPPRAQVVQTIDRGRNERWRLS